MSYRDYCAAELASICQEAAGAAEDSDVTAWQPIEYDHDEEGSILLPEDAPFDGKAVLIKTSTGVVEAWWHKGDWSEATPDHPAEYDGWYWVCYDDQFQVELDDVKAWMPIPQ